MWLVDQEGSTIRVQTLGFYAFVPHNGGIFIQWEVMFLSIARCP